MSFWTRRKCARRVKNNIELHNRIFRRRFQNVHGALKADSRIFSTLRKYVHSFWSFDEHVFDASCTLVTLPK